MLTAEKRGDFDNSHRKDAFIASDGTTRAGEVRGGRLLRPNVPMSLARTETAEGHHAGAPRLDGRVKPL